VPQTDGGQPSDLPTPSELHPFICTLYERILQDEIAQSLRPNAFTPAGDVQQMRQFYFDRVTEIVKDKVIAEKDLVIQQLHNQLSQMTGDLQESHALIYKL